MREFSSSPEPGTGSWQGPSRHFHLAGQAENLTGMVHGQPRVRHRIPPVLVVEPTVNPENTCSMRGKRPEVKGGRKGCSPWRESLFAMERTGDRDRENPRSPSGRMSDRVQGESPFAIRENMQYKHTQYRFSSVDSGG